MTRFSRFVAPLALGAALCLGACSGEADVDTAADTTAGDDTMNYTPADSGMPSNAGANSSAGDTSAAFGGDTTASVSTGGDAAGNAALEELVVAQLGISPGYSDVRVDSEGDAVIVLDGTVASAEDKAGAEAEVRKIAGVKSVKNNLVVK